MPATPLLPLLLFQKGPAGEQIFVKDENTRCQFVAAALILDLSRVGQVQRGSESWLPIDDESLVFDPSLEETGCLRCLAQRVH